VKVSVIGAGSWGSAVAWLLGDKGNDVCLWARNEALVDSLNTTHHNPRYLEDVAFSPTVTASTNLAEALNGAEAIVLVTPSSVVSEMAGQIAAISVVPSPSPSPAQTAPSTASTPPASIAATSAAIPLVLLSKGIEGATGMLLLDVLARALGSPERLAVLSGPNHAEEVARGILSATVVASSSPQTAEFFQDLFATPAFRVYTSSDTTGVQLCGAAKNIVAIACGLAAGLGFGDNTTAMLMTRGLAEVSRLATQLGGDPLTCMGLAGMGDLIATCTSPHSRNRAFGLELAQGGTLASYQERTHMVVEGALACKTVTDLASAHGVDMPISRVVRSIVWDNLTPAKAVTSLIDRSLKPEFY
jgi:glycerol-3-phosphate dehydrogenase (NAD(P)+)